MEQERPHSVHIDLDRLEWEWVEQPTLYQEAAEALANARQDLDEAEAKLSVLEADLALKIRSKPDEYGLEVTTEASYKAAVLLQPERKKQALRIVKAKHRVAILQARVTALDHKKKALEKLVDLHGQSYFSRPTTSQENREVMALKRKRELRRKRNE